jgi:PPK2 family polyphosphate:nucleotide phosphotransferase
MTLQERWMFDNFESPYLVPFDGSFRVADCATAPPASAVSSKKNKKKLKAVIDEIRDLQSMFYAHDHHALLLVFQAMDAAGKDGTIRAVMSGVNPAGCEVYSFKRPSSEELDHDFLWRTAKRLPQRGRIGIFNRSYYEEVLVVRVHPGILNSQRLPSLPPLEQVWSERFESIRDHEKHVARNGTVVLKFWLNVSQDEQKSRLLRRIDDPARNWKFEAGDLRERKLWPQYMEAYQDALNETSRAHAPWFAIPADDKPFMRLAVATVIRDTLAKLEMNYPQVSDEEREALAGHRAELTAQ